MQVLLGYRSTFVKTAVQKQKRRDESKKRNFIGCRFSLIAIGFPSYRRLEIDTENRKTKKYSI